LLRRSSPKRRRRGGGRVEHVAGIPAISALPDFTPESTSRSPHSGRLREVRVGQKLQPSAVSRQVSPPSTTNTGLTVAIVSPRTTDRIWPNRLERIAVRARKCHRTVKARSPETPHQRIHCVPTTLRADSPDEIVTLVAFLLGRAEIVPVDASRKPPNASGSNGREDTDENTYLCSVWFPPCPSDGEPLALLLSVLAIRTRAGSSMALSAPM
jgi:hypothetical protein